MSEKLSFGIKIVLFLAFVGVASLIYFSVAFIHEYGHYWNAQRQGAEVTEFVLLGWKKSDNSSYFLGTSAWIRSKGVYDQSFDAWLDCPLGC